jgi:ABC-type lipoprotein export system ATPase subunit
MWAILEFVGEVVWGIPSLKSRNSRDQLCVGPLAKKELSTVVVVTHDHQMASLADRILEIRDGMIVKETEIV